MLPLVFLIGNNWRAKAYIRKIDNNQVLNSAAPAIIEFSWCGVSITSFKS